MALRTVVIRSLKCFLCGAVSGCLVSLAALPAGARPKLTLNPACPDGPRVRGGRLVCCFCGGSLYLDTAETELQETQTVYPRERRGRPPGRTRQSDGAG